MKLKCLFFEEAENKLKNKLIYLSHKAKDAIVTAYFIKGSYTI